LFCVLTTVTIGGFIVGTTVGWSSPAGPLLENNHYGFNVTEENVSWIAALVPFGALLGCPAIGGLVDKLGRKNMMIILTAPTFIGWAMIIWAQSVSIKIY
jgi:SP family facilitated glucose transporter-like MFS transporter 8